MTRSGSARTARRTSRSSIWRCCAPSPNLMVFRPADTVETAEAWEIALTSTDDAVGAGADPAEPADPAHDAHGHEPDGARAPMCWPRPTGKRQAILMATGSEVEIAHGRAGGAARPKGIGTRVVSMPCWELFEEQDETYRRKVLPAGPVRVAVEAAVRFGWDRWLYRRAGQAREVGLRRDARVRGLGADGGALPRFRDHRGGCRGEGEEADRR